MQLSLLNCAASTREDSRTRTLSDPDMRHATTRIILAEHAALAAMLRTLFTLLDRSSSKPRASLSLRDKHLA